MCEYLMKKHEAANDRVSAWSVISDKEVMLLLSLPQRMVALCEVLHTCYATSLVTALRCLLPLQVIVFCDELPALEYYAKALMRPFLYGNTSHKERTLVCDLLLLHYTW